MGQQCLSNGLHCIFLGFGQGLRLLQSALELFSFTLQGRILHLGVFAMAMNKIIALLHHLQYDPASFSDSAGFVSCSLFAYVDVESSSELLNFCVDSIQLFQHGAVGIFKVFKPRLRVFQRRRLLRKL